MIPKNKYPVYIPSKGRWDKCFMADCFVKYGVDFKIVVEPSEAHLYAKKYGADRLLVLPADDFKLLNARNWIRNHSIALGYERHWQFDDNIRGFSRFYKYPSRINVNPNLALFYVEKFTDNYENIGISGFEYEMFAVGVRSKIRLNRKQYSACLINNKMPYKWRLFYNDDIDLCLQVMFGGLCVVTFTSLFARKIQTMVVKGGNTDEMYAGDGRYVMARTLQQVWGETIVSVKVRYGRPQHVINWKNVPSPALIRKPEQDLSASKLKTAVKIHG